MKIVLVGCPDSGKSAFAQELVKKHPHLNILKASLPFENLAFGEAADYRTEMYIAARRAARGEIELQNTIQTNSLIDSVCYAGVRLRNMLNSKSVLPRTTQNWALLLELFERFMQDSFRYDLIFFLPGHEEENTFYEDLEEAYSIYLELEGLAFTTVTDPLNFVEEAAKMVEEIYKKENDGASKGSDPQQSDE